MKIWTLRLLMTLVALTGFGAIGCSSDHHDRGGDHRYGDYREHHDHDHDDRDH